MSSSQQPTNFGFFPLKPSDLQDPQLFRLNQNLQFIYQKLSTLFSPGSSPTYPSSPTFQQVNVSGQSQPPTDQTALLTLQSANTLYAPAAARAALLSGSYPQAAGQQTQSTLQQPIPQGAGPGGSGTLAIEDGGAAVGTRPILNFISGGSVTISAADDPGHSRVDVTIGGGGGSGTVTHTSGALTADQPVFGNGGADIKVGTKTGNTDEVVSATGSATANYPLLYDASGNAIARQPRGNTTVVQLADSTTNPTTGDLASFDGNGNVKDSTYAAAKLSQAILTTKGDLLTYSTTPVRLGVGTNGQVLTANSAATDGVDWEAPTATVGGVNEQVSAYLAVSGDYSKLLTFPFSSTLTLPASPPSSVWFVGVQNTGNSDQTISPNGLQIDGSSSNFTLAPNNGILIYTDGVNYFTERGDTQLHVLKSGSSIGTEPGINLIPGTNVTMTVADNPANQRVDITVNSAVGVGGFVFSPPLVGSYTWVNQGSATAVNTFGGGSLDIVNLNGAGAWSYNCLVQAIPTAPYRYSALITVIGVNAVGSYSRGALILRNSTSGKILTFEQIWRGDDSGNGTQFSSAELTNATTLSGGNPAWPANPVNQMGGPGLYGIWMALEDDGTNRKFEVGLGWPDKVYWETLVSQSNSAFIVPDQIGFAVQADTATHHVIMRVFHQSTVL